MTAWLASGASTTEYPLDARNSASASVKSGSWKMHWTVVSVAFSDSPGTQHFFTPPALPFFFFPEYGQWVGGG